MHTGFSQTRQPIHLLTRILQTIGPIHRKYAARVFSTTPRRGNPVSTPSNTVRMQDFACEVIR